MSCIVKKENKKYYKEINTWRGILVILVVLGHSINTTTDPSILGFIHDFIYIFHMPALFVISGFLFYKVRLIKNKNEQISLIKDKAVRLLIPYLVCTAISVILKIFLDRYARNPLDIKRLPLDLVTGMNNPNGGIWFLYILFILSVIAVITYKIDIKLLVIISIVIKLGSLMGISILNINLLGLISNYSIYYFGGIFAFEKYEKIQRRKNRVEGKKFLTIMELLITICISYINIYYFENIYLKFFISLMLIYISYKIAVYIKNNMFINICGKYGMAIYIIGYYIQQSIYVIFEKIIGINYYVYWIFMFGLTLIVSILINKYIIQKVTIFKVLLLGER